MWLPGMIRVAPLSARKSDSAQIALMVIGMCGRGSGINCVSSWIGCASWPGPSTSEQNDDNRHSLSSTRSTTGSTFSCSGDFAEHIVIGEEVVDADGLEALERGSGGAEMMLALDALQRRYQALDQFGARRAPSMTVNPSPRILSGVGLNLRVREHVALPKFIDAVPRLQPAKDSAARFQRLGGNLRLHACKTATTGGLPERDNALRRSRASGGRSSTRALSMSAGEAVRFGPSRSRISARTVAHSRSIVLPAIRIGIVAVAADQAIEGFDLDAGHRRQRRDRLLVFEGPGEVEQCAFAEHAVAVELHHRALRRQEVAPLLAFGRGVDGGHRLLDVGLPLGLDDLEQAAADDVDGAGQQLLQLRQATDRRAGRA